jgi:hypothetical protein
MPVVAASEEPDMVATRTTGPMVTHQHDQADDAESHRQWGAGLSVEVEGAAQQPKSREGQLDKAADTPDPL